MISYCAYLIYAVGNLAYSLSRVFLASIGPNVQLMLIEVDE